MHHTMHVDRINNCLYWCSRRSSVQILVQEVNLYSASNETRTLCLVITFELSVPTFAQNILWDPILLNQILSLQTLLK